MKFGFDLDGTLDKPELAYLVKLLLGTGHEVHVLTSYFPESGDWQAPLAKKEKLDRLGILWKEPGAITKMNAVTIHTIPADPGTDIGDRLRTLGLKKGILSEQIGLDLFFDDSATFCDMIPRMDGHVTVLQVR